MTNKSDFAIRLGELFKKNKVTTATLSQATDISAITINKIRNGQNSNPTVSTILAIANYFGVSIDYLVTGSTLGASKTIQVTDIDNFEAKSLSLEIDNFFTDVDFAVRISNNNYSKFVKDSLVLIKKNTSFNNDDTVLVKLKDSYTLCTLIIEDNMYIGKSLTISEKYYDLTKDSILGVVSGVIWTPVIRNSYETIK
ncbi:MAG: Helix-turn-helix domain [Burkholderiales bacterium]|jgi:transcriptional regulator with XRE-family HTH domain|nr:Helix-turn-helix domain [Burkholderiales bacterium]